MSVYVSNIKIDIGADFYQLFHITNPNGSSVNLSGFSGKSILKKHPASLTSKAEFEIIFPDPLTGKIAVSLGSSITSYLKPGRYCYDIVVENGTIKNRVVEGSALVTPGVTNPFS
jgi:hypothetical protein